MSEQLFSMGVDQQRLNKLLGWHRPSLRLVYGVDGARVAVEEAGTSDTALDKKHAGNVRKKLSSGDTPTVHTDVSMKVRPGHYYRDPFVKKTSPRNHRIVSVHADMDALFAWLEQQ